MPGTPGLSLFDHLWASKRLKTPSGDPEWAYIRAERAYICAEWAPGDRERAYF